MRPALSELRWPREPRAAVDGEPERPTWAYHWPAGERLSSELASLVDLRGRSVADLGCGRGRLALAAWCGGAARVCACDISHGALRYVAATAAANAATIATAHHVWGEPVPGGPYDVVLGGDILYRPECFAALFASIAGALGPGGQALLSDPRGCLEAELPELAADHGLHWAQEHRPARYSLVRLVRTGADRADRRR